MNSQQTASQSPAPTAGGAAALPSLPPGPPWKLPSGQRLESFTLGSGLRVLALEDRRAPVVAYQTWLDVGSALESARERGLSHLLEHMMFLETETLGAGEMDRRLEELGAETNAATWLDWTQYTVAAPSGSLTQVIEFEADRLAHLRLSSELFESERQVVLNERRYRVDDDVDGALSEALWLAAFQRHPYRYPTIGSQEAIESLTVDRCRAFYQSHYQPSRATLVVVGDFVVGPLRDQLEQAYARSASEPEAVGASLEAPEPLVASEHLVDAWTPTAKAVVGLRAPAMGDPDHVALGVACEVIAGGNASRLHRALVRDQQLASDVSASLSPLRQPGLVEFGASGQQGVSAEALRDALTTELRRLAAEPPNADELARAQARFELELWQGLTTVEGQATSYGFHARTVGDPLGAIRRAVAAARLTSTELQAAIARHLDAAPAVVVLAEARAE